jgi:hypothetical protein
MMNRDKADTEKRANNDVAHKLLFPSYMHAGANQAYQRTSRHSKNVEEEQVNTDEYSLSPKNDTQLTTLHHVDASSTDLSSSLNSSGDVDMSMTTFTGANRLKFSQSLDYADETSFIDHNDSSMQHPKLDDIEKTPTKKETKPNISPLVSPPKMMRFNEAGNSKNIPTLDIEDGENEDDEETNSLVSEYGSDVVEYKIRLDDIQGMGALLEEEEDDNQECSDDERRTPLSKELTSNQVHVDSKYSKISDTDVLSEQEKENTESIDVGHRSALLKEENSDDIDTLAKQSEEPEREVLEEIMLDDIARDPDNGICLHGNKQDQIELEVKASNEHNIHLLQADTKTYEARSPIPSSKSFDSHSPFPSHKSLQLHSPSRSHNKTPTTPTTPIATVSAVIRKIGEGVSHHMTNLDLSSKLNNRGVQGNEKITLSPRFRSHDFHDFKSRELPHQPKLESCSFKSRSPLGACLPFEHDYRKFDDSPPSSPYKSSPKIHSSKSSNAYEQSKNNTISQAYTPSRKPQPVLIRSPQRVDDIEREDALDILSVLVERSLVFHQQTEETATNRLDRSEEEDHTNKKKIPCDGSSPIESDIASLQKTEPVTRQNFSSDFVYDSIESLRKISENHQNENAQVNYSHSTIVKALDELQRSYTYALEMKRAALSASTWLKAIGRTGNQSSDCAAERQSKFEYYTYSDEESHAAMNMHRLRSLLVEKEETNKRLDHELTICRAEIGRLKSPDKSILDDDDSTSTTSQSDAFMCPDANINLSNVSSIVLDTSYHGDESDIIESKKEIIILKAQLEEAHRKISILEHKQNRDFKESTDEDKKDSLQQDVADALIESNNDNAVHENLTKGEDSKLDKEEVKFYHKESFKKQLDELIEKVRKADMVQIESLNKRIVELTESSSTDKNPEQKMVNVRMLDAENFMTDWDKCGPLPPPPDHGLHSPIISDLLSQWTNDPSTQKTLLSWMENVIEGANPEDIQPLKIFNLNHQVRDGFSMHILPILLRRSDINVQVTSRAHRTTTYDLSVNIDRLKGSSQSVSSADYKNKLHTKMPATKSQIMAFRASRGAPSSPHPSDENNTIRSKSRGQGSVTHSAVTDHISNSTILNNTVERLTSDSVPNHNQNHQLQGIMSGAMNAVGGLWMQRKVPQLPSFKKRNVQVLDHDLNDNESIEVLKSSGQLSTFEANLAGSSLNTLNLGEDSEDEENQPYHRVVSAPPGRIGLTFVQYRGHAMISDVYTDSPLSGWVFPSDILIAIDEVPVSGLRVIDIVKLLNDRKGRQRALRVISSHAMTEMMTNTDPESSGIIDD